MRRMTTPGGTAPDPQDGGERRLARPPSDRYRSAAEAATGGQTRTRRERAGRSGAPLRSVH